MTPLAEIKAALRRITDEPNAYRQEFNQQAEEWLSALVQRVEELEARLAKHANVPVPPASLPEKLSVEIPDDWNSEGD
jgi:BMFP domain-containing protein YqiC